MRTLFDWQVERPAPKKLVVEALVATNLVEVAWVVVLRVMLLKICAPVQVGEKD